MPSSWIIVIAILLVVAVLAWTQSRRSAEPEPSHQDVVDEMKLRASQAVDTAREDFDTDLDYSPESIERVDSILGQLHEQHRQNEFDHQRLVREALQWGAYVGEAIKKLKPAEWAMDSEAGGPGSLPIVYDDGSQSFPVGWCYKRIVNGEEDNIWHKFSMLVLERDTPGAVTFGDQPEADLD